ncbi:MAG: hypothetical protein M3442_08740 [Chloroflexota bacterium]|nr:hypothetical protein [Chloroflexota bacterium]
MVGVISPSLRTVIERIERATARGGREFQISLPCWGALNDAEVATFFREVCGRFPALQFLHYNLPRAGRLLTAPEYATLARAYPNLVATKYGGADLRVIADLLRTAGALRHFFTETGYMAAFLLGKPGFLVSFASSSISRAWAYYAAGVERDTPRLMTIQRDPRFPLRLLPPYQSASDAAFERYRDALKTQFPQWIDSSRLL